jgi:hypothetical protein
MAWYDDFFKINPAGNWGLSNLNTTAKVLGGGLGALGLAKVIGNSNSAKEFLGIGGANTNQPVGYQGGIPDYTATRTALPITPDPNRRPGSGGRRYFSDVTYNKVGNLNPPPAAAAPGMSDEELSQMLTGLVGAQESNWEATTPTATTPTATTPTATTTTATKPTATTTTATKPTVTNLDITNWLKANPKATDDQIAQIMDIYKVTPQQVAAATGADPTMVNNRYMNASIRSWLAQNPKATDTQVAQAMNENNVSLQQIAAATGTPIEQVTQRYNDAMLKMPVGFTDIKDITDVTDYAKTAAEDKSFSSGETSNLLNMAKANNLSPTQMAEMLGVTANDVVSHLRATMPFLASDYLKQYGYAKGGLASLPQSRGYYLGGATDGMADKVPARIDNTQEAKLSDGEFVLPADIVSHLGNGNSQAGAKVLYDMMDRVRRARTGRVDQGRQINPNKYTPA